MIALFVFLAVLFGDCLCCDDDTLKRCSFELEQKMSTIPGFESNQLDHPVPEQLPSYITMGMSFFKDKVCSHFSKYGVCIEKLTITGDCNARHVWLPDIAISKGIKLYKIIGETICPKDSTLSDILSKIKPAVKPNSSPFETSVDYVTTRITSPSQSSSSMSPTTSLSVVSSENYVTTVRSSSPTQVSSSAKPVSKSDCVCCDYSQIQTCGKELKSSVFSLGIPDNILKYLISSIPPYMTGIVKGILLRFEQSICNGLETYLTCMTNLNFVKECGKEIVSFPDLIISSTSALFGATTLCQQSNTIDDVKQRLEPTDKTTEVTWKQPSETTTRVSRGVCVENGKTYFDGESVPREVCELCSCQRSRIECANVECPKDFGETCEGGVWVDVQGVCCSECRPIPDCVCCDKDQIQTCGKTLEKSLVSLGAPKPMLEMSVSMLPDEFDPFIGGMLTRAEKDVCKVLDTYLTCMQNVNFVYECGEKIVSFPNKVMIATPVIYERIGITLCDQTTTIDDIKKLLVPVGKKAEVTPYQSSDKPVYSVKTMEKPDGVTNFGSTDCVCCDKDQIQTCGNTLEKSLIALGAQKAMLELPVSMLPDDFGPVIGGILKGFEKKVCKVLDTYLKCMQNVNFVYECGEEIVSFPNKVMIATPIIYERIGSTLCDQTTIIDDIKKILVPVGKKAEVTPYQFSEKSQTTPWYKLAVTASVGSIKLDPRNFVLVLVAGVLTRHFIFY